MLISRKESWGSILYDTSCHEFRYQLGAEIDLSQPPYVSAPLVLNCYLTHKCNLLCRHCVARDMATYNQENLVVTPELITQINQNPAMVIVITGGEPLLPVNEVPLRSLISGLKDKGIVVDTNGTIRPSSSVLHLLKRKNVLVRISLDSMRPQDEICLRCRGNEKESKDYYLQKLDNISYLAKSGVKLALQSVLHKKNYNDIKAIAEKMRSWNIRLWYIQRLIPTRTIHPSREKRKEKYFLDTQVYEKTIDDIEKVSLAYGIRCITKKDRRHNCVFLVVGNGDVYTSSDNTHNRVYLGKIGYIEDFFAFVSSSEHSARYYSLHEKKTQKLGGIRNNE